MGDEEERRELSEGLKDGLLLSPWSTNKELGRSSRAWEGVQDRQQQWFLSPLFTRHIYMQLYMGTYGRSNIVLYLGKGGLKLPGKQPKTWLSRTENLTLKKHIWDMSVSSSQERKSVGLSSKGYKSDYAAQDVSTSIVEATQMFAYCQGSNYICHTSFLAYASYFQQ